MADNFLEKQYQQYQDRKAAQEQARRRAWQKKMKQYKAQLAARNIADAHTPDAAQQSDEKL